MQIRLISVDVCLTWQSHDGTYQGKMIVIDTRTGEKTIINGPQSQNLNGNLLTQPLRAEVTDDRVNINLEFRWSR